MSTVIFKFEDFIQLFNFNRGISYEDFSNKLSILNISDRSGEFVVRSDINTFISRVARRDTRAERLELYKRNLYRMLVLEPEVALKTWFKRYGELPHELNYYFDIPQDGIRTEDTFQGIKNSKYGRVCKNINFDKFYNTRKLYANDSEYTFGLLRAMFEDFKIRNSLAGPAFFDHICQLNGDYNQFWTDFMIGANRASIFNPATYRGILDDLFEGDTIFAPVMGWNAYQFGFYSSTRFKHFISTDVIPEVVDNGRLLHNSFQAYRDQSIFELDDKTIDLYCCPSEELQARHQFVDKYRNKVDAVLFSPPYYDLEIYDSPDQSLTNYPNYDDWLVNYWERTIELCEQVLKKNGRLGFIISNYRNKDKKDVTISEDMMKIVSRHLTNTGRYKVQWSAISTGRQAAKMRGGNFEDLWLFEKR
jgi:hypothetical protein